MKVGKTLERPLSLQQTGGVVRGYNWPALGSGAVFYCASDLAYPPRAFISSGGRRHQSPRSIRRSRQRSLRVRKPRRRVNCSGQSALPLGVHSVYWLESCPLASSSRLPPQDLLSSNHTATYASGRTQLGLLGETRGYRLKSTVPPCAVGSKNVVDNRL